MKLNKLFQVMEYDMTEDPEQLVIDYYYELDNLTDGEMGTDYTNFKYLNTHPLVVKWLKTPLELINLVRANKTMGREKHLVGCYEYLALLESIEAYEHCEALKVYIDHLKIEMELLNPNKIEWTKQDNKK